MFVLADRVKEVSDTTGMGAMSLRGAAPGFQTFAAGIGEGNSTYYTAALVGGAEWEVGIGTVSSGTLTRDTVLASSAAGAKVNFSVGGKDVFATVPATELSKLPGLANVALSGAYSDLSGTPGPVTTDTAGLMSSGDKTKLDGVESGATKTTAGTGLSSTGSAFSVEYGTDAGTAAQGNDSRITGAFPASGGALTGGATGPAAVNDGTKSSGTYTPSPSTGNWRKITNGGAHTIAAPTTSGCYNMTIDVTNNSSAGAITFSGFVTGYPKGDDLTTTNGNKFKLHIFKSDLGATAFIEALQ